MVDAKPGANHHLVMKHSGRPRYPNPWIKVSIIGEVRRRPLWANTDAAVEIENSHTPLYFGDYGIVFPAHSQIQSKIRLQLPFVLEKGKVESAAKSSPPPGRPHLRRVQNIVYKRQIIFETQYIIVSYTLIEANPPNFAAHLESVPPMRDEQIVLESVGCPHLVIRSGIEQRLKIVTVYLQVLAEHPDLGIVIRRPIDAEF